MQRFLYFLAISILLLVVWLLTFLSAQYPAQPNLYVQAAPFWHIGLFVVWFCVQVCAGVCRLLVLGPSATAAAPYPTATEYKPAKYRGGWQRPEDSYRQTIFVTTWTFVKYPTGCFIARHQQQHNKFMSIFAALQGTNPVRTLQGAYPYPHDCTCRGPWAAKAKSAT